MNSLRLRCSSKGIGDMVCGLYAAQALKNYYYNKEITYYVFQPQWFKYVTGVNVEPYLTITHTMPTDLFVQTEHKKYGDWTNKTRKEIYTEQIPLLKLKPNTPIVNTPKYNKLGSILLFPYALWDNRTWNLDGWISLEQRLLQKYNNVMVLGAPNQDVSLFTNGINNLTKDETLDLIINSRIIVSNDSGMAHVAGLYNIPTVTILNSFSNEHLFSQTNVHSLMNFNKIKSIDVFNKIIDILDNPSIIKHTAVFESTVDLLWLE